MDQKLIFELITVPLFTGVIGYVTNWTGVLMLFKPVRFRGFHVPGLKIIFPIMPRRFQVVPLFRFDGSVGWQGIVPSRADKMASIAVDKGLAKLGSVADFYAELDPDSLAQHLAVVAQTEITDVIETIMMREHPAIWTQLPPAVRETVHSRVRKQLPSIVKEITDDIGQNVDQLIDVKLMVIRHYEAHPELLEELWVTMCAKELRFMRRFGIYFGVPAGFVLVAIIHFVPQWWVLPLGGVVIGWVANYLAITIVFEPVFPKRWVPWKQGLIIRRQQEVTESYATLIADDVITVENIGHELLHGTRSDRTQQMLEDAVRPAVDRTVGPMRAPLRVALGTKDYRKIQDSFAVEATAFAPAAFGDEAFNKAQSKKIYSFVSTQMSKMGPDDYTELLRAAIRQDEWLLFVHGGVLGLFAGFLHLAIFGV